MSKRGRYPHSGDVVDSRDMQGDDDDDDEKTDLSPSGNRTPVFRVTGGDTVHYTNEERPFCCVHRSTRRWHGSRVYREYSNGC